MTSVSPRVLHIITAYFGGGAETLLARTLEELDVEERKRHTVVSLRSRGDLAQRTESIGIPVRSLGMGRQPARHDAARVYRLAQLTRQSDADVVQTWMLHANVLGGLVARLSTGLPVVWGVHLGSVNRRTMGTKAVLVQRAEAVLSWLVPTRIVACSAASRDGMRKLPYRHSRILTIPNGFNVANFRPSAADRASVRAEIGVGPETIVIGNIARFHPAKGHSVLAAAARRALRNADARLVMCGENITPENPELRRLFEPIRDKVVLLGDRPDIARVVNGFDFAVSSSLSEALPLAVGEAMSSGLPVIATDTGDSAELVGDTSLTVPAGDAVALGGAISKLLATSAEQRADLGRRARERITDHYSMATMVDRYREVWNEAARDRRSR